jgi:transcriptional regulator with XRE-family HTH domain
MAIAARNYWSDYGHRLRVTRIVLGISEKEAAAAHGVTLATYRKWENGRPPRSSKPYLAFTAKYDVNLDWLIAGEAASIGGHLSKLAPGKVALLQVKGPLYRRVRSSNHIIAEPTPPAA